MPDISEDSAIFGITTAFPGCNPDFMLGFEADMVWGQLWSSKNPVKIIVQKANLDYRPPFGARVQGCSTLCALV
jgi:hypothetical protein